MAGYTCEKKDAGVDIDNVKWQLLKKCHRYEPGGRMCDVCLSEKLSIRKKQGAQLLEPDARTSMHSPKSQNSLVCEGEVTPADARGHGEGGQVKAGRQGDRDQWTSV